MNAVASAHTHQPRGLIVWLSLAQLVTWGSTFYTFALLMEPIERELGFTRAQSSLGFSIALLTEGLFALTVGRWIDAGHERRVMTGGSLLVGVTLLAHSAVQSLTGFYAVWALLGAGMAATLYAPVFAVVTRRFPQDFRRAIITMTFLGGLASTVFIPLSAWLVAQLGWRQALWVLAALQFALCAPLHAHWLRHAPAGIKATPDDTTAPTSATQHMRSAPFLLIAVFVVCMMAVTAALPAHLIPLLREAGLSEAWVIVIPASIGVIQVVGRLLLYFFEHRFNVHWANALIPCLLPLGLLMLLLGRGHALPGLLFVLLFGLGNGLITIVKGTAIAQYVDRTHVATLNGALGLPQALARAAAPFALGVLWSPDGGYAIGLWLMLACSALAVGALWGAQRASLRKRPSA
ncbi:MAG: MFS transporter [Betaproteobacteria bacterium]|nr:MFS transporter [Betaproteobacteria bacterium]